MVLVLETPKMHDGVHVCDQLGESVVDLYENKGDDSIPSNIRPAIWALRKASDDAHWYFGQITRAFCYSLLHDGQGPDTSEYLLPLEQAKLIVGPAATQRFDSMLKVNTPPAVFKGFFDLYLEGVTLATISAFNDLLEIGRANQAHLNIPHIEWATDQSTALIRAEAYRISIWIRNVCDVHLYDPDDDTDEIFLWKMWQAPSFLIMKPSRFEPYDPHTAWERKDAETSGKYLKQFSDAYILHLEVAMKEAAGEAAIRFAKEPRPIVPPASLEIAEQVRPARSTPRRESAKLDTQEKYRDWEREYKRLKKQRPNESDVWYSQRIAKLPVGKGSSAETIRRRMKC